MTTPSRAAPARWSCACAPATAVETCRRVTPRSCPSQMVSQLELWWPYCYVSSFSSVSPPPHRPLVYRYMYVHVCEHVYLNPLVFLVGLCLWVQLTVRNEFFYQDESVVHNQNHKLVQSSSLPLLTLPFPFPQWVHDFSPLAVSAWPNSPTLWIEDRPSKPEFG